MNIKKCKKLLNLYTETIEYDLTYNIINEEETGLRNRTTENIKNYIKTIEILINEKFKTNIDLNYYWKIQDITDEKIKTIYELQEEIYTDITNHITQENKTRKEYKTKKTIDITKVNNYYWSII